MVCALMRMQIIDCTGMFGYLERGGLIAFGMEPVERVAWQVKLAAGWV